MMGPDGGGGGGIERSSTAAAAGPSSSAHPPPPAASSAPLLRKLSVRHEQALLAQWDAEEQATLDTVLSKLPHSKHSALER